MGKAFIAFCITFLVTILLLIFLRSAANANNLWYVREGFRDPQLGVRYHYDKYHRIISIYEYLKYLWYGIFTPTKKTDFAFHYMFNIKPAQWAILTDANNDVKYEVFTDKWIFTYHPWSPYAFGEDKSYKEKYKTVAKFHDGYVLGNYAQFEEDMMTAIMNY